MPYEAIGTIIALGVMAYAFYEAENRGRLIILVLASATFIIPELFSTSTIGLICYISRILIGIGCYIYVKIRHA